MKRLNRFHCILYVFRSWRRTYQLIQLFIAFLYNFANGCAFSAPGQMQTNALALIRCQEIVPELTEVIMQDGTIWMSWQVLIVFTCRRGICRQVFCWLGFSLGYHFVLFLKVEAF